MESDWEKLVMGILKEMKLRLSSKRSVSKNM